MGSGSHHFSTFAQQTDGENLCCIIARSILQEYNKPVDPFVFLLKVQRLMIVVKTT